MNSTISGLSIAVIAASLLAVGVVAAISMTEEADAQDQSVSITNSIEQRNRASVDQSGTVNGGGSVSQSATVTQSQTASQSNSVTQTR